jgi:hypothetical protein
MGTDLANLARVRQGRCMSCHGKRVVGIAFFLVSAGSLAVSAGVAASEPAQEILVMIRHAEKPEDGLGQLNCQGLNRSLALPKVLTAKFGKPNFIFAPNPQQQTNDKGLLYDYIRPLATIEPTAIQLGLPVNTQFGFRDVDNLRQELTQTKYEGALVFVAWEHSLLVKVVKDLVAQGGGDPSQVPEWGHDDFDSIYVVKLTRVDGRFSVSFTRDKEGLDNRSPNCPQAVVPFRTRIVAHYGHRILHRSPR